jgi:hypothetical protein
VYPRVARIFRREGMGVLNLRSEPVQMPGGKRRESTDVGVQRELHPNAVFHHGLLVPISAAQAIVD